MPFRDQIDINKLLSEVDKIVDSVDDMLTEPSWATPSEQAKLEQKLTAELAMDSLVEPNADGECQLSVTSNGMEVWADFLPPIGAGKPVTLEQFQELVEKKKIVHGLIWPWIKNALNECAMNRKTLAQVCVAKGTEPQEYIPEHDEILPELLEKKAEVDQKSLNLDFKTQSPFIMVKAGDLLTFKVPERTGAFGYDVFGNGIPFPNKPIKKLEPGPNVVASAEGYRAACDGCFNYKSLSFQVDKVLQLKEGVDYRTGNINFAGDLLIKGEIAPGFTIKAEGSIFSNSVVDATDIECGGELVTSLGIIGKKGSVIKAQGGVKAKFVENIYISSKQAVQIQTSSMNSIIQTLDEFRMGPKGLIIGGRILAQNKIDVYQVGSERGGKAELICGMDYQVLEKIGKVRDHNIALVGKLKVIEAEILRHPDQAKNLQQAATKIREEVTKLNEIAQALVTQIDKKENAEIIVRGTIFPGNYLEICHVSFVVSRIMTHTKFYLDKKQGKIVGGPI